MSTARVSKPIQFEQSQSQSCGSNPCLFCNIPIKNAGSPIAIIGFLLTFGLLLFWLILIVVAEGLARKHFFDESNKYSATIEENRSHHRTKITVPFVLYVIGYILAFLNMLSDILLFFLKKHVKDVLPLPYGILIFYNPQYILQQIGASLIWLLSHILWLVFCFAQIIRCSIDFQEMNEMPMIIQEQRIWQSTQLELAFFIFVYTAIFLIDMYFIWVIGVYTKFLREDAVRVRSRIRIPSTRAIYPPGTYEDAYLANVTKSRVDSSHYSGLAQRTEEQSVWNLSSISSSNNPSSFDPMNLSIGSRTPLKDMSIKTDDALTKGQ